MQILDKNLATLAANTIRMLAVDGIQKANSGHPGMPMGMADCAFVLWNRFLRFNPKDPDWLNRDRFVLSAGHGSMLLYSMLFLSEYDVTLDDLKSFRQWGSKTPGHPEYKCLPGVETTTGPLGQGFGNAVGMAIAEIMMAARFNSTEFPLINHTIFTIAGDGDLMEGVCSEAASLAGHLKLDNLVCVYDDNQITIEGETNLTFSEDVQKRFESYGWHTLKIDGHNHDEIESAIQSGIDEKNKPTLIIAKTHIAYGSPNKQDTAGSHGSPIGEDEIKLMKEKNGWPLEPAFYIPEEVKQIFQTRNIELNKEYEEWQNSYQSWCEKHPEKVKLLKNMLTKSVPENLAEELVKSIPEKPLATRVSSGKMLQKVAELIPGLTGGSADLAPSTKTLIDQSGSVSANNFNGRNFHFGIREHGMGAILNGMAEYGGLIPYGATFLVFSDYMRPSIRLAALMNLQVIYVFTHDSIFVGEDGPTHQPIEHVAALRSIPNLTVFRPADSLEVAMAWSFAVNHKGPTALSLTRQTVSNLERPDNFKHTDVYSGGYILAKELKENLDLVIIATGSEVDVALNAKQILEKENLSVRIVSMPSVELFKSQSDDYQKSVVAEDCHTVVVEAGISFGWQDIANKPTLVIGIDRFGESAPYKMLAEKFGFTGEQVAEKIKSWMK